MRRVTKTLRPSAAEPIAAPPIKTFARPWSWLSSPSPHPLPPVLQNVYVNINRIMSVGNRLLESGHYASQQIKQISSQLEKEWKAFAAALDERSTLLEMSGSFHQKCDQVSSKRN